MTMILIDNRSQLKALSPLSLLLRLFMQDIPSIMSKKIDASLRLYNKSLLRAPLVARNPNLQVVITHASHVCIHHSFGLPLRMNGMQRTKFDHAHLYLLPLVI